MHSQSSVGIETQRNSRRSTSLPNKEAAVALTSELSLPRSAMMAGISSLIASWKGARMHSQSSVGMETQRNSRWSMNCTNDATAEDLRL
jgi:hypothetical protein